MPNPTNPAMFGLQKAQSIGADPKAEAFRQMDAQRMDSSVPNPENKGASAIDALSRMVRQYAGPVQETLGETHPDFTPMGGEQMYNIARGGVHKAGDAALDAYHALIAKLGGTGR